MSKAKINKKEISKALNIYWSAEDDCYIAEHKDYDRVAGIGDSRKEAEKTFFDLLKDYLPYEEAGKVVGRPKKNNVKLTYNVLPETKEFIESISINSGKNQGIIIDEIVDFYKKNFRSGMTG